MPKESISIAIPIYNEVNGVFELIENTYSLPLKKEIIIIDDGSTNKKTKQTLYQIKKHYPAIRLVENKKNLGKAASIQKALKMAHGDLFVILDGDSELDPKDIAILYQTLKNTGARLVNGTRVLKHKPQIFNLTSILTRMAKKISSFLVSCFYGVNIKDVLSGYKLFYTKDFQNHNFSAKHFGLETELILETLNRGDNIAQVDVSYNPRTYKEGKKIQILDGIEILLLLRKPLSLIFLALFAWLIILSIYFQTANSSPTTDPLPNIFTAINIVYNKRFDITNFKPYLLKRQITSYVAVENQNHLLYAKTPVINGLLAAPFIFLMDKYYLNHQVSVQDFLNKDYETYYQSIGKYYGATLTSFAAIFIFATLFFLFRSRSVAFFGTLVFALASSAYGTAAQANWQHGPSLLLISISYFLLLRYLIDKNRNNLLLISTFLTLATLLRIVNILFLLTIILMFFINKKERRVLPYLITPFLVISIVWHIFLQLLHVPGGYDNEIIQSFRSINFQTSLKVIVSLLFSPNVGLLRFSPVFIFAFLGIAAVFMRRQTAPIKAFLLISTLSFVSILIFNSIWWAWEGGYSWGPRLLTEGIPFLVFLGGYFFSILKYALLKIIFFTLFIYFFLYSFFVQTIGVYAFDTEWQYKYYVGRSRLDMAWYNKPDIINFYSKFRKIFFNQKIIKNKNILEIKKDYYFVDFDKREMKKIKTSTKSL